MKSILWKADSLFYVGINCVHTKKQRRKKEAFLLLSDYTGNNWTEINPKKIVWQQKSRNLVFHCGQKLHWLLCAIMTIFVKYNDNFAIWFDKLFERKLLLYNFLQTLNIKSWFWLKCNCTKSCNIFTLIMWIILGNSFALWFDKLLNENYGTISCKF